MSAVIDAALADMAEHARTVLRRLSDRDRAIGRKPEPIAWPGRWYEPKPEELWPSDPPKKER